MMPLLLDPHDDLAAQNRKLRRITEALMGRVERELADSGPGHANFALAAALEEQVRARTRELDEAFRMLSVVNARLTAARQESERARLDLADALEAMEEGFALFDPQDALIMCNSRFSGQLPDVAAKLGPGLKFVDYVRLVAQSRHLDLPEGDPREDWARQRMLSHRQASVNLIVQLSGDRWLQVSAQRMPSGGTAVVQTDVTSTIVAERQKRAQLRDDQAQLMRAMLDHITQGVVLYDAHHRLAGWNRRMSELISLPVRLMRPGVHVDALLAYLQGVARIASSVDFEAVVAWTRRPPGRPPLGFEMRRDDGGILAVDCRDMPDGGYVISMTDMTGERQAADALARANETLESRVAERTRELEAAREVSERAHASKLRFVAGASHDLLQPLNAAKLFLSSLSHTRLDPNQRIIAERIGSAFESVETILGALLDISNLDIGAARAEIAPLPLGPLMASIGEQFQPLARERGLALRVLPCAAWVESDAAYLRRILQNLVGNALRYTKEGRVLVGVRRCGADLRLEVLDTGPGIPPERRDDIFREFVRLETAPDTQPGMGLGLAIVERACALLGHRLALDSRPGRGTRFALTLPRAPGVCALDPATPDAEQRFETTPRPSPPLDDMIVVVIEDDDAVRAGMISVLEDWGASPLVAPDAAAAETLIADIGVAPDVIIADYLLEGGASGIEAIARLRAGSGPVPAVLVSADRSEALRRQAQAQQVTLLHKPLELHRLRAVLQWAKNGGV